MYMFVYLKEETDKEEPTESYSRTDKRRLSEQSEQYAKKSRVTFAAPPHTVNTNTQVL